MRVLLGLVPSSTGTGPCALTSKAPKHHHHYPGKEQWSSLGVSKTSNADPCHPDQLDYGTHQQEPKLHGFHPLHLPARGSIWPARLLPFREYLLSAERGSGDVKEQQVNRQKNAGDDEEGVRVAEGYYADFATYVDSREG